MIAISVICPFFACYDKGKNKTSTQGNVYNKVNQDFKTVVRDGDSLYEITYTKSREIVLQKFVCYIKTDFISEF